MSLSNCRGLLYFILFFGFLSGGCNGQEGDAPMSGSDGATEVTSSTTADVNRIRVLIIDGVNNHDWERTTEATKATLEQTGRFTVEVSTSPSQACFPRRMGHLAPEVLRLPGRAQQLQ